MIMNNINNAKDYGLPWLLDRLPVASLNLQKLAPNEHAEYVSKVALLQQSVDNRYLTKLVDELIVKMGGRASRWQEKITTHLFPLLGVDVNFGVFILLSKTHHGFWIVENVTGRQVLQELPKGALYSTIDIARVSDRYESATTVFKKALLSNKNYFWHAAVITVVINLIALVTSLYSMQVYDRVIPSQGISTLFALTLGAVIAIVIEMIGKLARSSIVDGAIKELDTSLSNKIFERLLRVRMDQFPPSVGTLSAQLRSYEMIRSFAMSVTLYILVDLPFAFLFLAIITAIAGLSVASVPLMAFFLSLFVGLVSHKKYKKYAALSQNSSNKKLGLLVEVIDGAESVKATGSGWQFLARWNALTRMNVEEDLNLRHQSETSAYFAATVQQISYVMLVGLGAYIASTSNALTSGGIIACSILSGRVLQPVSMLPGLMVQWANATTAMKSIDGVFSLKQDNHDIERPVSIESLTGRISVENLAFSYPERTQGVSIANLQILPGEKIAVIGGVGSGKTTFLKLLAGLYVPHQGRLKIDGLDIEHISRTHLSNKLGFLPQDLRLFGGTLRDNLLAGIIGVTEQQLIEACKLTGLIHILSSSAKGLDLLISEGGGGLSGGQRQIIGLTRLILSRPDIWLLDEPTASMDQASESVAIKALTESAKDHQTVILVTHKPALLQLVSRIIVINKGTIVLDGPRESVLQQLTQNPEAPPNPTPQVVIK